MPLPLLASVLASSLALPPVTGMTATCLPTYTNDEAPYEVVLSAVGVLPVGAISGGVTCRLVTPTVTLVARASGSVPVLFATTTGTVPSRGRVCVSSWYRTVDMPDGEYVVSGEQCS